MESIGFEDTMASEENLHHAASEGVCQVCFARLNAADTIALSACSHRCCTACLRQYLRVQLARGKLSPRCFFLGPTSSSTRCDGVITAEEIRRVADAASVLKFERFLFNAEHPVFGRQCPYCDHSQVWPHGRQRPRCTCAACGRPFCFSHGNAHVGRSCTEYENTVRETEKSTHALMKRTTKHCPGCCAPVEKDGGCNHMTCLQCGASFCWICLALIEQSPTPDHYQGWKPGGCSGLQNADIGAFSRLDRFQRTATRVVATVAVGVPALAVTLVLTVATVGWYPCRGRYGMTFSSCVRWCFEFVALMIEEMGEKFVEGVARHVRDVCAWIRQQWRHC